MAFAGTKIETVVSGNELQKMSPEYKRDKPAIC
jgi:hypothetical protein